MTGILIAAFFALFLFCACYCLWKHSPVESVTGAALFLLFLTALLPRLFLACFTKGQDTDIFCFGYWAERIFQVGPRGFYSPEVFADYPPGYLYLLWPIGALTSLLELPFLSPAHTLLLKLPAIICDLLAGLVLYREGRTKLSERAALIFAASYLYNPAIILNSAVWGQVDSVFTLALILFVLSLMKGRMFSAYAAYGFGILIKPQTLIFTPVLMAAAAEHIFSKGCRAKKLLCHLLQGLSVLFGMYLLCRPFGLLKVLSQYLSTLTSYPYASVNAYNLYGFLGLDWASQETALFGVPLRCLNPMLLCAIVAGTFLLHRFLSGNPGKYPLLCAFVTLTMFTFSVRMHERYSYPALFCLLLSFLCTGDRRLYFAYGAFSILNFLNTAHVLFLYDPADFDPTAPVIRLISFGFICCMGYFYTVLFSRQPRQSSYGRPPVPSAPGLTLGKWDLILLTVIMTVYSLFALYDLGDRSAPESACLLKEGDAIDLSFSEDALPVAMAYYIAPRHDRHFAVEYPSSDEEICLGNVFTWNTLTLNGTANHLRLTLLDDSANILELVFLDGEGNVTLPANAGEYPALFDENHLYPEKSSFRNSMYFDEIYHARTAYEFLKGLPAYENTHPPLGKILIALGIAVFGMNPFGWRITGTVFGILMLPILYGFAKKVTKSTAVSALSCVLFAFDFMHFAQTRLATIDVYITFFVLLMYFCMYCYLQKSFYDTPLKETFLPLGACGISMGLGIACKWTGIYAGAGLAILFFGCMLQRYREYLYAKAAPNQVTAGIPHQHILHVFLPNLKKTIAFCLVFFAVIPAGIYLLSYLPFRTYDTEAGLFFRMFENQGAMLRYHSHLNARHPFASPWYQWPLMSLPIWYYSGTPGATLREGISAFGNPLVWWVGIPAFLYMLYLAFQKKDPTARMLTISYLAQYLPWVFVTRITFIYHYFPSVPFVVLMIAHSLMQFKPRLSKGKFGFLLVLYGLWAFVLFVLFYPVLAGQPVEASFVDRFLRWLPGWIFTAD